MANDELEAWLKQRDEARDDAEFKAWLAQCEEDRAWYANWDPGDEWIERYGAAFIKLYEDMAAYLPEYLATPEGRRMQRDMQRDNERFYAKHAKRLAALSQPPRARAPRKPSLATRVKAAAKAGALVDIKPDGTVSAAFGTEPIPNEWDTDLGIESKASGERLPLRSGRSNGNKADKPRGH